MVFRFVVGKFNRAVQKEVSQVGVVVVVWCTEFRRSRSFFKAKELFQVAGKTISPNNKVAVYCGWYCRGVWAAQSRDGQSREKRA
jgi:hypothetical protein